jgi:uncharacterized UPF0160 family protein
MEKIILSRSFGTHDGSFHADEVTACALLIYFQLVDRDKIVRTRQLDQLSHLEYVCDVGGIYQPFNKRFDHHQSDYQGQLSSAGMVLEYLLAEQIIDEDTFAFLQKSLIIGVDEIDNGLIEPLYGHATFSSIIASFVPVSYEAQKEEYDRQFQTALDFVLGFLQRIMAKHQYAMECKEKVVQAMRDSDHCLIFDEAIPWIDVFFENDGLHHSAQFVMMPSHGHWKLRGIPPSNERRMQVRTPLPEKWAGLLDDELKKVTGIPGAIFCHKGRFTSVWQTKQDALQALKMVKEIK